jgi:peptidyl-prolyl cis-trans isomerase B (cyclophilin B)
MAARREAAHRKRQLQARIAGGVAGVLALGAVIWAITAAVGGGDEGGQQAANASCVYTTDTVLPTAGPTADPTATATATATADPSASPSPAATLPPGVKDIGRPVTSPPRKGFQVLTFETNLGEIQVEMDLSKTPCTANSMNFLATNGFYNGSSCHRLVQDIFALQCGDPAGDGTGGPNYSFADENLPVDKLPAYHEGDVAMANGGANTNGSQFFFVYGANPLQGDYSLWGRVIKGLDIIKQVAASGDDEVWAAQGSSGGRPNTPLNFTNVTAGPVTDTPAPTPSPTASATPTAAPTS